PVRAANLDAALAGKKPGDEVTLTVQRGAKTLTVEPELAAERPPAVLAPWGRRYTDLARRNIFTGVASAASRVSEAKAEVLRLVRLTTVSHNGRRWEAFLYDQAKGGKEMRLNLGLVLSEFTIQDKYETEVLKGEVALIDDKGLVFKADGKFYRVEVGEY